jgi:hypothetical protein
MLTAIFSVRAILFAADVLSRPAIFVGGVLPDAVWRFG